VEKEMARVLVLSVVALLLVQCNAEGPSIKQGEAREMETPEVVKPKIPAANPGLSQRERLQRAANTEAAKPNNVQPPKTEEPVPPKAVPPPVQEEPAKKPPKVEQAPKAQPPKQEPAETQENSKGATPHLKSMADDDQADEKITAAAVAKKAEEDVKRAEDKEVLKKMREAHKAGVESRRDDHTAASAAARDRLDKKLYEGGQVGDRKLGSRTETTAELAMKATEDARARAASARQKVAERVNGARAHHSDITQRGRRFQEGLKAKTDSFKESIASRFNKISVPVKDDL